MHTLHRLALLALSTMLSCAPAICGASDVNKEPVRIGVSMGLTGAFEKLAVDFVRGYQLWEQHVNASGGILGRPVSIIIVDDKSNSEAARTIYKDFIVRDKVDFVIGPYSSGHTEAVAAIVEEHKYPMLSAAVSEQLWTKGRKYLLGIGPTADRYSMGFLNILGQAKIRSVAVVYADDPFSTSVAAGVKKWADQYAVTVKLFQKVVKGTPDLTGPARAARESGAQAVLMAGHYEESVNMRKALKQIAWTPSAYYASIGPTLDAYHTALGPDAEGTFTNTNWEAHAELKLPGSDVFLRDFVTNYKEKPSNNAARAYATGQILEQAIRKAGTTDREKVTDALYRLDTMTLIGRYAINKTGAQSKGFPMITQWQKGKREIVEPDYLRTASPVLHK